MAVVVYITSLLRMFAANLTNFKIRIGNNTQPLPSQTMVNYPDGGYWNGFYSNNSVCAYVNGTLQAGPSMLACTTPLIGRYLSVQLLANNQNQTLTVCDIKAYQSEWPHMVLLHTDLGSM